MTIARMSKLSHVLNDLWVGLSSQPARTGLSFVGIAIGICSLSILLAVLGGLENQSKQIIRDMGVNVFAVTRDRPLETAGGQEGLRRAHVGYLAGSLPGCLVSGVRVYTVPVSGIEHGLKLAATDERLCAVRGWKVLEGRFLDATDLRNKERCGVASRAAARLLDWRTGDAVKLGDMLFRLVGIVEPGDAALQSSDAGRGLSLGEYVVFVPISLPPYWTAGLVPPDEAVDTLYIRAPAASLLAFSVARARDLLAQPDRAVSDLVWVTPDALVRQLTRLQRLITVTIGSITFLCLVLGGTTLMSLMVANVRDRVKEIGLRRTLGATTADIVHLFVLEACLLTAAAGIAGIAAAGVLLWVVKSRAAGVLAVGWFEMGLPLVAALILGVAFSYWPARMAAGIAPADALRNE